jgi:hypothetical protein
VKLLRGLLTSLPQNEPLDHCRDLLLILSLKSVLKLNQESLNQLFKSDKSGQWSG